VCGLITRRRWSRCFGPPLVRLGRSMTAERGLGVWRWARVAVVFRSLKDCLLGWMATRGSAREAVVRLSDRAWGLSMTFLETDYLVIGAGAAGMAFTDELIAGSEADVVMVDRRHRPRVEFGPRRETARLCARFAELPSSRRR